MKLAHSLLSLLAASGTFATVSTAQAAGASTTGQVEEARRDTDRLLSEADERAVLREIDNICGDTWCEGEFDYSFKKLDCRRSTRSCSFQFDYIYRIYEQGSGRVSMRLGFPTTCKFENILSGDELVDRSHGRTTYSDRLYNLVNDCINSNEPVFDILPGEARSK
jgi:hypothetical protein